MRLTQIACVAIDLARDKRMAVCEEILAYGETDLVCYRAGDIPALYKRQEDALAPVVEWAAAHLKMELAVTDNVMPVTQPATNTVKLEALIASYDECKLAFFMLHIGTLLPAALARAVAFMFKFGNNIGLLHDAYCKLLVLRAGHV